MSDTAPSYDLLQFVVERVNVGVFVVEPDYTVTYWNNFMATHSEKGADYIIGKNLFDSFPDLPARWFRKKIDSVFVVKSYAFTSWEQRNFLFNFKHNRPITGGVECMFQNLTLIPIKNDSGKVEQVMVFLRDSTDEAFYAIKLKEAMAELERISQTDGLTGLYNRLHWEKRMAAEFKRAQRYGNDFSLLMLDIDHFKQVNDQFGHLAGDEVIRVVSDVIRDSIRESDVAGRYGGEEFGVILTETDLPGALCVGERIRERIMTTPVLLDGVTHNVTVSVGLALYDEEMERHEDVIARADEALYESKQAGRNRVTLCIEDKARQAELEAKSKQKAEEGREKKEDGETAGGTNSSGNNGSDNQQASSGAA